MYLNTKNNYVYIKGKKTNENYVIVPNTGL